MSAFSAEPMPLLKTGAKGSSVFDLQLTLFQLGFLTAMPSGTFDALTASAVRAFQSSIGLQADGAVGNQTWQRLESAQQKAAKTTHTVQPGDTLWSLARKYGVTVYMITQANNLKDSDELKVDMKLVIPVVGKTTAKTASQNASKPINSPAVKSEAQKAREAQARLAPALMVSKFS
jgi:LysM repeat protein